MALLFPQRAGMDIVSQRPSSPQRRSAGSIMGWDLDHQVLLDACVHGRFESETEGKIWRTQAVFMFLEAVSGLLNIDPASKDHFGARGGVCCCLHRASDRRADAARRPRRPLISARLQVLSPRPRPPRPHLNISLKRCLTSLSNRRECLSRWRSVYMPLGRHGLPRIRLDSTSPSR